MMEGVVYVALILAMAGHSSAAWCVCKGVSDATLQKTLDYACGAGADCNPIHQNGACYNPNTVRGHCNYAVNSYFQKKGQAPSSCDFAGTAIVSASDPSTAGCAYPTSASSTSTGTTPATTTPSSTTPTTVTPSTSTTPSTNTPVGVSPYITTPTGVLGPTGINTDISRGSRPTLRRSSLFSFSVFLVFSAFMLSRG